MPNVFIILSSLLASLSYIVYIIAIVKGKAKPHRTTRFILVLITALATAALFAKESTTAIWLSGIFTLGSLIVFLLSLKYGMGGWSKTDLLCLCISLIGIIVWKTTEDPLYGLIASLLADLMGQIPMIIKTLKYPETEIWTFYGIDVLAALFSLLALPSWTFTEYAYPLYILCIDCFIVVLIIRPKLQKM